MGRYGTARTSREHGRPAAQRRLGGTSGDLLVQKPATTGSPAAGCSGPRSARLKTLQPAQLLVPEPDRSQSRKCSSHV